MSIRKGVRERSRTASGLPSPKGKPSNSAGAWTGFKGNMADENGIPQRPARPGKTAKEKRIG